MEIPDQLPREEADFQQLLAKLYLDCFIVSMPKDWTTFDACTELAKRLNTVLGDVAAGDDATNTAHFTVMDVTVPVNDSDRDACIYEVEPRPGFLVDARTAWEMTHRIAAVPGIHSVEPLWEILGEADEDKRDKEDMEGVKGPDEGAAPLFRQGMASVISDDQEWAPKLMKVPEAYEAANKLTRKDELFANPSDKETPVVIAHPDSGRTNDTDYPPHKKEGYDFINNCPGAFDYANNFHGTRTASVMAGSRAGGIYGVAPGATILPLRVSKHNWFIPSPVLFPSGQRRLRRAINFVTATGRDHKKAVEKDSTITDTDKAHVMSVSLGWTGSKDLQQAITRAYEHHIIVIAAASNFTGPYVSAPGRYRETICVAGCDATKGEWWGSARGTRVDVCAPGEDVWVAARGEGDVMQSSGTSHATAMTAGVAAMWIAKYGRDKLIKKAELLGVKLTELFRYVLVETADYEADGDLDTHVFGGIVDAEKVLAFDILGLGTNSQQARDIGNLARALRRTKSARPTEFTLPEGATHAQEKAMRAEALFRLWGRRKRSKRTAPVGPSDSFVSNIPPPAGNRLTVYDVTSGPIRGRRGQMKRKIGAAAQVAAEFWNHFIQPAQPINVNFKVEEPDPSVTWIAGANVPEVAPGLRTPVWGYIVFNAKYGYMPFQRLVSTLIHEMGHTLGFGCDAWMDNGEGNWFDGHPGRNAIPRPETIVKLNALVPGAGDDLETMLLEDVPDGGTYRCHWEEDIFLNELMTGYKNTGDEYVLPITFNVLALVGHTIINRQDIETRFIARLRRGRTVRCGLLEDYLVKYTSCFEHPLNRNAPNGYTGPAPIHRPDGIRMLYDELAPGDTEGTDVPLTGSASDFIFHQERPNPADDQQSGT